MRVMSEPMLIEETVERTSAKLQSMLGLIQLSFEAGRAAARQIHAETGRIIDPVASSLYEEAHSLLMLPYPQTMPATAALTLAGIKEPRCYGSTLVALLQLLEEAVDDTVEDEIAAAETDSEAASTKPQKLS